MNWCEALCTGKPYKQKTEGAVCDELKQRKYMKAYVEEAAGTTLCDVASLAGACTRSHFLST